MRGRRGGLRQPNEGKICRKVGRADCRNDFQTRSNAHYIMICLQVLRAKHCILSVYVMWAIICKSKNPPESAPLFFSKIACTSWRISLRYLSVICFLNSCNFIPYSLYIFFILPSSTRPVRRTVFHSLRHPHTGWTAE